MLLHIRVTAVWHFQKIHLYTQSILDHLEEEGKEGVHVRLFIK